MQNLTLCHEEDAIVRNSKKQLKTMAFNFSCFKIE